MDTSIDNDKRSGMSLNDTSQKSPLRKSKRGMLSDSIESQNDNEFGSKSGALVLTSTVSNQTGENQLRLDNAHLQLQLEAAVKFVSTIKKNISSYESIVQKINPSESKKGNFTIGENSEAAKFLQMLQNNETNINSHKKRKSSRGNSDTFFNPDREEKTLNSKHISEVLELQGVVKKYKAKIKILEKKLHTKHESLTDSPTDTEEQSEHSIFNPKKNIRKSEGHGKRGRPKKAPKPIGRPRKTMPIDPNASSSDDQKPKKSVGRPKRSLPKIYPTKYLLTGEPVEKKARGRPKKTADNEEASLNNTTDKISNDEDNVESNESSSKTEKDDKSEDTEKKPEQKRSPRKLPSNEEVAADGDHKRSKGRPRKNVVSTDGRRGRGRPKTTNVENGTEEEKDNDDTNRRSRGRPKKVKSSASENGTTDSQ